MADQYGARVDFYGRSLGHAQVMADRQAFDSRWPERDYRIEPSSLRLSCNQLCHVSGVLDFNAYYTASRARSRSRSSLELMLRPVGARIVIAAESRTVLWRH
jgi:hypothetical protein